MDLSLDIEVCKAYKSPSQRARKLTEDWVLRNLYCPRCGHGNISQFENNRPVADFFCPNCLAEYELKGRDGPIQKKIPDGAYKTMIQRITSLKNPDFFFMHYSMEKMQVVDLDIVPKHFFIPQFIERRKPLKQTVRRAGWIGCNILLSEIPKQGRISVVASGIIQSAEDVVANVQRGMTLQVDVKVRGWLFDVLNSVNRLGKEKFTLEDIYAFKEYFQSLHPKNKNIEAKIRQQLQFLRDKGILTFLGHGCYQVR